MCCYDVGVKIARICCKKSYDEQTKPERTKAEGEMKTKRTNLEIKIASWADTNHLGLRADAVARGGVGAAAAAS